MALKDSRKRKYAALLPNATELGELSLPAAKVYDSTGTEFGLTVGSVKDCTMAGCRGNRYAVVWQDGTLTWPCGKGIWNENNRWQIK